MKKLSILFFAALLLLVGCNSNSSDSSSASFKTEPLENLQDLLDDGYTLVDVREIDEYNQGHIPNALNVPLSNIENDDYGSLSKDEKYVVICRSGNRSKTASEILSKEGFTIVNLESGMSSWTGEIE